MSNKLPVAVVLSGCGVYDGTEITEAVSLLIALSQAGVPYQCFAPVREQYPVVDHVKGLPANEARHIFIESARIARGNVLPLAGFNLHDYSALAFPGGFGAAKNLTTFIDDGADAQLYADIRAVVLPMLEVGKPLLALCAAPLVLGIAARDAGLTGCKLTFGDDAEGAAMIAALKSWGQTHVVTRRTDVCVDSDHHLVTAPAYMYSDATPAEVFACTKMAVQALCVMLQHEALDELGTETLAVASSLMGS